MSDLSILIDTAHQAVTRALLYGELVRPDACSRCSQNKRLVAHHEDYSKQLEVVWLCYRCHRQRHREIGFNYYE